MARIARVPDGVRRARGRHALRRTARVQPGYRDAVWSKHQQLPVGNAPQPADWIHLDGGSAGGAGSRARRHHQPQQWPAGRRARSGRRIRRRWIWWSWRWWSWRWWSWWRRTQHVPGSLDHRHSRRHRRVPWKGPHRPVHERTRRHRPRGFRVAARLHRFGDADSQLVGDDQRSGSDPQSVSRWRELRPVGAVGEQAERHDVRPGFPGAPRVARFARRAAPHPPALHRERRRDVRARHQLLRRHGPQPEHDGAAVHAVQ